MTINHYILHHFLYSIWNLEFIFIILLIAQFSQCILNPKRVFPKKETIPRSNSLTMFCSSGNHKNNNNSLILERIFKSIDDPPWNLSPLIDFEGFIVQRYRRVPGDWENQANISGLYSPISNTFFHLNHTPVTIRQVPGDGNCLFHSLSTCLSRIESGIHVSMRRRHVLSGMSGKNQNSLSLLSSISTKYNNLTLIKKGINNGMQLYESSRLLREKAVDILSSNPRRLLFLQGSEYLRCGDLVETAASQYGLSGKEYCKLMRRNAYWGGGPEIIALVNVLKRPIHVYELCRVTPNSNMNENIDDKLKIENQDNSKEVLRKNKENISYYKISPRIPFFDLGSNLDHDFGLRRMACFGSPKFDGREPLHILSADSRFPDISPGKQLSNGNHFFSIFPSNDVGKNLMEVNSIL